MMVIIYNVNKSPTHLVIDSLFSIFQFHCHDLGWPDTDILKINSSTISVDW